MGFRSSSRRSPFMERSAISFPRRCHLTVSVPLRSAADRKVTLPDRARETEFPGLVCQPWDDCLRRRWNRLRRGLDRIQSSAASCLTKGYRDQALLARPLLPNFSSPGERQPSGSGRNHWRRSVQARTPEGRFRRKKNHECFLRGPKISNHAHQRRVPNGQAGGDRHAGGNRQHWR